MKKKIKNKLLYDHPTNIDLYDLPSSVYRTLCLYCAQVSLALYEKAHLQCGGELFLALNKLHFISTSVFSFYSKVILQGAYSAIAEHSCNLNLIHPLPLDLQEGKP